MRSNTTQIVLNDTGKTFYKMENIVRVCSEIPNSYVITVFDCCREDLNNPKYRGGGEIEQEGDETAYRNLILFNGCPPNKGVEAKSSIATEFFTKLETCTDSNGTIMLPGKLRFWQPGNKGDKVIDIRQDLHFLGPPPKASVSPDIVNAQWQAA